jgi:hypothetical protein
MIFDQSIEKGIGGSQHPNWGVRGPQRLIETWLDMVAESNKDKPISRHVKKYKKVSRAIEGDII